MAAARANDEAAPRPSARDKQRELARFARAHAAIDSNTAVRLASARRLREMGCTFPEIAAACTERPITPEGVKQILIRADRTVAAG